MTASPPSKRPTCKEIRIPSPRGGGNHSNNNEDGENDRDETTTKSSCTMTAALQPPRLPRFDDDDDDYDRNRDAMPPSAQQLQATTAIAATAAAVTDASSVSKAQMIVSRAILRREEAEIQPGVNFLREGGRSSIAVTKVTTQGVFKSRYVTVSRDRTALYVTKYPIDDDGNIANVRTIPFLSNKGCRLFQSERALRSKFTRHLDVSDLDSVHVGVVASRKLERSRNINSNYKNSHDDDTGNKNKNKSNSRLLGIDSFVDTHANQIVTVFHHGNSDTLDLLIENETSRNELVACLRNMIAAYRDATAKWYVSNDALLLRYVWYTDVLPSRKYYHKPRRRQQQNLYDANLEVTQAEFRLVLASLNLYLPEKVWKRAYREYRNQALGRTPKQRGGTMKYHELASLLHKLKGENTGCNSKGKQNVSETNDNSPGNNNSKSMSDRIWDDVFGKDQVVVDATEFMTKFYHGEQGESTATLRDVQKLLLTVNEIELDRNVDDPDDNKDNNRGGQGGTITINRARFEVYLHHDMNSAYDPVAMTRLETLNEPIARYWINTSHNTYLTGDQLTSASSVEMYIRSLQRGCKCLELDCWDGELTDESGPIPVVFHGHTVTSKILFGDIVHVVKSYLDDNPHTYPIILSLENHCSPPFQRTLAFLLEENLGEHLYIPTVEDRKDDLPSPEHLRGKVIIKGKRPPEEDDDPVVGVAADGPAQTPPNGDDDDSAKTGNSEKKIVAELSRLTLFHGTKFKSFEKSIVEPVSHMHSFSETKISKILKAGGESAVAMWRQYNVHHMTRTYPVGTRVDSSNYSPVLAWSLGSQLVALNFQTNETPLFLNDGMFRKHHGCGYLKRPDSLLGVATPPVTISTQPARSNDSDEAERDMLDQVMDSFEETAYGEDNATKSLLEKHIDAARSKITAVGNIGNKISEHTCKSAGGEGPELRLRVRVLSGSCLPKPNGTSVGEDIDPYVIVTIHDVARDSDGGVKAVGISRSTNSINNNGYCPVWDEQHPETADGTTTTAMTTKDFPVHHPDVAMVEFAVMDHDVDFDDRIATAAIPVSNLREGYRSIQLCDKNGTRTGRFGFATLLVEIRIFKDLAS